MNPDIVRSIRTFFRLDDLTQFNCSGIGQVRSDGSDRTYPRCQTRVSVTPKVTGLMKSGVNWTHINQQAHIRWDANVELGIGWARDRMWTEGCEGKGPALIGLDGPDSMLSGSDVTETQLRWPPDGEYPMVAQSGRPYIDDSLEEARSPRVELEDAVARLQKDLAEYRKELGYGGARGSANSSQTTRRSGYTSTLVPRYSGKSSWEQYRHVFEAIVCSNGWDDVTATLQLLSHLDGDALNVALLVPESQRVLSGVLTMSLSEHYGSPRRLVEYSRQFRRDFRHPGDAPSVFAIELETLAQRVFADVNTSIQLQLVRDRFITGQAECALRRHLDIMGPDTPMRDIVDSCHTEATDSWSGGPDP